MKTLLRVFVIVTCISMLFVSCKKDEEAPSCDGKGALHYYNNSGQYIKIIVDDIDYGDLTNNRAIEISLREGTFHYIIYLKDIYSGYLTLGKEGDVTIVECEAVYMNYN